MDPDKIMDDLAKALGSALKSISKTKNVEKKEIYSRIVKNLSESLGIFLTLANEMIPYDYDDYENEYEDDDDYDYEDDDIPF